MQLQGIEGRRNEIVRSFDQQQVELIRRFDEDKARLLAELDTYDEADISRLQGVKGDVEDMRMSLQEMVSLHDLVGKNGTDVEKFIMNFACRKKDELAATQLKELKNNNYSVSLKLRWREQIQNLINSEDLSAHLQVTLSTSDDDPIPFFDDFNLDDFNINDAPAPSLSENGGPRPVTLTLEARLDLKQSNGDVDFPSVTGLAFIHDGRIAAVDNRNRACFIMNASLQRLGTSFRFQNKPKDIACFHDSNLAVTLVYVHEFNVDKQYLYYFLY